MINELILENYQNHIKSHFKFVPGMNVVVGRSDEGKSAVIRALKWMVENTPRGIAFKNWEATKKDKVKVTMITDEGSCQRIKQNESNGGSYILNDDEENAFKALRTDVPESISNFLRIAPYQIRSQHDDFFLLSDAPGPAAAKLNEVAGLSVASGAVKSASVLIRASEARKTALKDTIDKNQSRLEELDWVGAADKALSRLEKYDQKLIKIMTEIKGLNNSIQSIINIEKKITDFPDLDKLEKQVKRLDNTQTKLKGVKSDKKALKSAAARISSLQKKTEQTITESQIKAANNLVEDCDVFSDVSKQIKKVSSILKTSEETKNRLEKINKKLEKAEQELAEKMKGRCALCGKK